MSQMRESGLDAQTEGPIAEEQIFNTSMALAGKTADIKMLLFLQAALLYFLTDMIATKVADNYTLNCRLDGHGNAQLMEADMTAAREAIWT